MDIQTTQVVSQIENLFANRETAVARDLKLNLLRFVNESALEPADRLLVGLAVAKSTGSGPLIEIFGGALREGGVSEDEITEAKESAAIMAMLNTYYRFRHMVGGEDYRTAGLRMTSLAKPALGKKRFEMLAFAVSVINGCETCIQSHEKVLKEAGLTADQIHDLARVAAVTRGIQQLI